jgi:acyl carrier protein
MKSREDVLNVVRECLHEPELIEDDFLYAVCDSLDYIDMIMTIESEFDITLDESELDFYKRDIQIKTFIDWVFKKF